MRVDSVTVDDVGPAALASAILTIDGDRRRCAATRHHADRADARSHRQSSRRLRRHSYRCRRRTRAVDRAAGGPVASARLTTLENGKIAELALEGFEEKSRRAQSSLGALHSRVSILRT